MHKHASKHARSSAGASKTSRRRRTAKWARVALVAAAPLAGSAALATPALAQVPGASSHYEFRTINNQQDTTFNQLLGINQKDVIAGYFGSGLPNHPNQGYVLHAAHGQQRYQSENWPVSVQTQVTGLNDNGVTVGFWSSMNNPSVNGAPPVNDNRAFVSDKGVFIDGDFPVLAANAASPVADQLLGVNDNNIAVGFYNDAAGNTHAYQYNINRSQFRELTPSGIKNPTAAAINNHGDIAGFGTDNTGDASNGNTVGYLLRRNGEVTVLNVPGSASTMATGINDSDEVVGVYTTGSGANAMSFGFTWTPQRAFQTVNDPNGVGATTINGVNDEGQLVGFYTDSMGNTDGLLATPHHHG